MGIIMDENNPNVKDEKVIDSKFNCSIVAKMVKGVKLLLKMTRISYT